MKVYDKEIYSKQESIKTIIIIIIVFLLGFFSGYISSGLTEKQKLEHTNSTYVVEDRNN